RYYEHFILLRNVSQDSQVPIYRLSHGFIHAVVHHSRRIRHRAGVRISCANASTRIVAYGHCRRYRRGPVRFRLLCSCAFDYRSIDRVTKMSFVRFLALLTAILSGATVARGSVPIVVETGDAKRHVMKLCSDASEQLRNGDVAGAKRNINEALRIDPKLWPALYVRAEIFAREGKYELAIQDCNEALRQNRNFIDAALLRANINVGVR